MREDLFRKYLYYEWLRPESALADAVIAYKLKKTGFYKFDLDFGCGTGYFLFLMLNGRFTESYDMFYSIFTPDKLYRNIDIYDRQISGIVKYILKYPEHKIKFGCDIKKNSLYNALQLGVYKKVIALNANNIKLPFKKNMFNTVFSNIFYWLDNIDFILDEVYKILNDKGKLILCFPNENFKKYCFLPKYSKKYPWINHLDFGRFSSYKHFFTYKEMKEKIKKHNFKVINYESYWSEIVMKIWDIGIRPISPYLIKMTDLINDKNRYEIKSQWCEYFLKLLFPIYEMEIDNEKQAGAMHLFIIEKNE